MCLNSKTHIFRRNLRQSELTSKIYVCLTSIFNMINMSMYIVGGWSSIYTCTSDWFIYNYRRFYVQWMIHTGVVGLSVHLIHVCLIPLVFCNEAINIDESSTLALWCNTGTCHNIRRPNLIHVLVWVGHFTSSSNKN